METVTQSRLNLKAKNAKISLDNYIIHIILSVAFSFTIIIIGLNNRKKTLFCYIDSVTTER